MLPLTTSDCKSGSFPSLGTESLPAAICSVLALCQPDANGLTFEARGHAHPTFGKDGRVHKISAHRSAIRARLFRSPIIQFPVLDSEFIVFMTTIQNVNSRPRLLHGLFFPMPEGQGRERRFNVAGSPTTARPGRKPTS